MSGRRAGESNPAGANGVQEQSLHAVERALPAGRALVYVLSAVVMSLGWGLRGTIGGGPFGAMIPGAMVALCLCMLLDLRQDVLLIAAFGAVGVGFGGQMTYGQTIGFVREPSTFGWGLLGLTLKGAAWGFLGGAVLGLGFVRRRYAPWEIALCLFLLVVGTFVGWALVDHPKLLYFSNRYDKPREELLVGMYFGTACLLLLPAWLQRESFSRELSLWGLAFGGLGFGLGSLFMAISNLTPQAFRGLPYWKGMEFTFGALFGLGLAMGCWRNRQELRAADNSPVASASQATGLLPDWLFWAFAVCLTLGSLWFPFEASRLFKERAPAQGIYTAVGALLLAIALYSHRLAAQIGLTLTAVAFYRDFLMEAVKVKNSNEVVIEPRAAWGITFLMAMPLAAWVMSSVARPAGLARRMLLALAWSATIVCFAKFYILLKVRPNLEGAIVPGVFAIELAVVTALIWKYSNEKTVQSTSEA